MTNVLKNITDSLADAALLEMGGSIVTPSGTMKPAFRDIIEEYFVEIAFAEAAEYDQIHKAILLEHRVYEGTRTDACRFGDSNACLAH
jgi:hypothetical protein